MLSALLMGADSEPYMNTKLCNPSETNCVEVKAASTAPIATDKAAVVVQSPNGNHSTAANQSTEITSLQILDDVPTSSNGAFSKGSPAMGQLDDTSTTTATENNLMPVRITSQRAVHTNLRDTSGVAFGTATNPIYVNTQSQLTAFRISADKVVATNTSYFESFTMTNNIGLTDFHFGGRGIGQASISRYVDATTSQVPSGGFNSNGDVATWTNTGNGSSAGIAWVYATDQSTEGTGSAKHTFTQSDNNNYPAISYTWSSPQDFSLWRNILARVRVTVAAGGQQSRTVSIILTDSGGGTRTYSITGTTTTAPFSTEQWQTITGDIRNPTSESGTFDIFNVISIQLKLQDGGNKTGSIWWDDVELQGALTLIERIYIPGNATSQIIVNPAQTLSIGEVLMLIIRNNDASSKEFTAVAQGMVLP